MCRGFCKSYQEDQCGVIYHTGYKPQARKVYAVHSFRFFFSPPVHLHHLAYDVVNTDGEFMRVGSKSETVQTCWEKRQKLLGTLDILHVTCECVSAVS